MYYDFNDFLNSVKYLDSADILTAAYGRHKSLDKSSSTESKAERTDLQNKISGLLFFLEKQERPTGLSDSDFAKLKPICESLIKKNQLPAETIKLF